MLLNPFTGVHPFESTDHGTTLRLQVVAHLRIQTGSDSALASSGRRLGFFAETRKLIVMADAIFSPLDLENARPDVQEAPATIAVP
jgi:hypothetical protein